ncbi:unnamed protein product [Orchesella dallaii]|uniref:Uncharacterized protein n=1 Tax=Orchesella dallaii TaxID=48710 RepID=A0ABP1RE96_9HEXA
MFLAEKLWPIFLSHLRVNQIVSQSVHRFDETTKKLILSGAWTILIYKLKLGLAISLVLTICIQLIVYRKNFSTVVLAQSIFFFISYGSHAMLSGATLRKSGDLATLVNSMLDMERNFNAKMWAPRKGKLGKQVRHILRPFLYSSVLFAGFIGFYLWQNPCFPGNFGFMFLEECSSSFIIPNQNITFKKSQTHTTTINPTVMKASLTLFQVWLVNYLVANGCYYGAQYCVAVSHCIANYLRLFKKRYIMQKLCVD